MSLITSSNPTATEPPVEKLTDEAFSYQTEQDPYASLKESLAKRYGGQVGGQPKLHWSTWQKEDVKNQDMLDNLGWVMFVYFTHFWVTVTQAEKWSVFDVLKSSVSDHSKNCWGQETKRDVTGSLRG